MTATETSAPLCGVHKAIAAVIAEAPAIGKDSRMESGPARYNYRGIEQIKEALKPLLGKHGVHYAPETITHVSDAVETLNGKPWQRVRLTVGFRIYGPDGTSVPAVGRGEGFDNSDKANNKAMTMAEKQMLVQVFCVADGDPDPDHDRPERGAQTAAQAAPEALKPVTIAGLKGAIAAAIGTEEAALWWSEQDIKGTKNTIVPKADADRLLDEAKAWAHDPNADGA